MSAKILVVDDDPDFELLVCQKFRRQIQEQGLQFIFAHDGIQALEQLEVDPDIEVVLTDINMPDMDGLSLLGKIRETYPLVKAVIVSAYGDMDNIRRAMNQGAFDFLCKPINFQELEIATYRTLNYVHQLKAELGAEREALRTQTEVVASLRAQIVERQQAEAALRRSQATNQALIRGMPDMIIRARADGTYLAIAGRERFTVYDDDHFSVGTSLYDSLPQEQAEQRMYYIRQALATGELQRYEHQLTVDGQLRQEEVRIVVIGADEVMVLVRDITERKQAEAERQQFIHTLAEKNQALEHMRDELAIANATLEQRVSERTQALSDTLAQLRATQKQIIAQEKLASLGALTAGIAHEIKNPLNFVNNFAELIAELVDELQAALTPYQESFGSENWDYISEICGDLDQNARKIHEHGQRADGIVRSMLMHSRGGQAERQSVNINTVLTEALNLAYHGMRAQNRGFNITLETHLEADLPRLTVMGADLNRALLNLINNGFDATHEKVQQGIPGYEPRLTVSTRQQGDRVEIRLRDNGPGIPAAVKAKIFEPFYTTKPTGQGTGLGLSICHEIIVQTHRGEIQVDTETGEYTEFIITLPITPHQQEDIP